MDMAVAAASAAGETVQLMPPRRGRAPPRTIEDDPLQYADVDDLPEVDDLEVAAAAAAAATAALERAASAPLYVVPRRPAPAAVDDGASSMDEDDDEGDGGKVCERVVVGLQAVGDAVAVALSVVAAGPANPCCHAGNATDSDADSDIVDHAQLRAMIDRLDADDAREGEAPARAAEALGLPPMAALNVSIDAGDAVTEAGLIASLVEDMIVVQTAPGTRAYAEGSVLILEDRTPLGRIEDVFGPVKQPLYVLRYGGDGGAPPGASVGATVFAVDKFAEFVVPDKLVAKGYDAADADLDDPAEIKFSDDEEEAEFLAKEAAAGKGRGGAALGQANCRPANRSGRGRSACSGRGRGRGGAGPPARAGHPGGHPPPHYGMHPGMYAAPYYPGAPTPPTPYGGYPQMVPPGMAATYAASGYAPGGAPLTGWGAPPPAGGGPPAFWGHPGYHPGGQQ